MVDVGVVLPTRLGPTALAPEELIAIAEFVDHVEGWHDVWVTDSIISLPFYDSVVLLAACAARTQRVRLGVACEASLGLRQPLVVAQQWANLDQLSKGRMTMVACPGEATGPTREKELAAFNMTHREKVERMEESIAFLRLVSGGGAVTFEGSHFSIEDLELAPAFVQQPLPIWMTGNPPLDATDERVRRVLARVARLGDGWLTFAVTPSELARRTKMLHELRSAADRDPDETFAIGVFLNVNVNANADIALEDALATWRGQSTRNVSPDDLRQVAAIGSPEQVADFVGQLVDAGATTVALELLSADRAGQVETVSEHLLPLLVS
ncbi:MAG: LLM class flavin-dependent oxidoreductase [Acidimicrobiales bacterium]|jgi:alkanesulfonate monooxygenase SsuD/methylene tetrahydromethanopterin reductase-like flavin-dependent oxidoreductase (luciferase family)